MMPALAIAETSDTQSQIQSLLQQIQALQVQLKTLIASSSMNWKISSSTGMGVPPGQMGKMVCITLNRNLRQGDQGDDVKKLQAMLAEDPENDFHASATGFFGPMTMKAMMKFQMRMGIASSTDGSVGPMTRGFFERRCGKGLDDKQGKMPGGDVMGMALRGTITANNTTNVVVQIENGTSITVNVSASTTVKVFNGTSTPPTAGTVADLVVGKKAMVEGKKNDNGTVDARMIAVGTDLPMIKMMMDGNDKDKMMQGFMPPKNDNHQGPGNGGPQYW
jgi:peptidoglycan hydrolase-like protein with peptidoglycan-binding domain